MIPRIIILLSILFVQNNAIAQYQSLTLKPREVEPKSYKLNVAESTASFEPSNVGIIGMKYLHKPGSMSTVVEIYPPYSCRKSGCPHW